MKIFEINGGVFGSTGRIMFGIAAEARKKGFEVRCSSPITSTNKCSQPKEDYYKIGSDFSRKVNVLLARITGFNGCFAFFSTVSLLREMQRFAPDIVHLHTLHNSYVNIPLLFWYLKKKKIKVIWTLHDCWAFTGQCPHFVVEKCEKWVTGCKHCVKYKEYPASWFDNTRVMWKLKRKWFTQIEDLVVVTPSYWLQGLVKRSFLKEKEVHVIQNGIDLDVFKPIKTTRFSEYRDKYIILGVAFGWGYRKGLDVFIELSKCLPDKYKIVLVGTDEIIERVIPDNIIKIRRTTNQVELAEIYSVADVFVNPTREDTFPTVNIEALACGTPIVTFQTGGSPEIPDNTCGRVVQCEDISALKHAIENVCKDEYAMRSNAIARAKTFDMRCKFREYIALYESCLQ